MTYARTINSHGISHIDEAGDMHYDDGRVWKRGKCLNSMFSGCTRDVDWDTGGTSYCRQCAAEYEQECEKEKRREEYDRLCQMFESMGLLPKDFNLWKAPGMYAWQSQALNQIQSDYHRNAWLQGGHGEGKTVTGWALIQAALWNGVTAAYIDCSGFGLGTVCRNHNARRSAGTARLVILDDVSKMNITEYAGAELHNLLSERNTGNLRTVVIDQVKGKEFNEILKTGTGGRFGASTIERLSWKGRQCMMVEMRGENIRRK